jgi:hypothetical protein
LAAPAVAVGIDQTGTGTAAALVVFHGGVFRSQEIAVLSSNPDAVAGAGAMSK